MVLGAKYDQRSDVWSYGITLVSSLLPLPLPLPLLSVSPFLPYPSSLSYTHSSLIPPPCPIPIPPCPIPIPPLSLLPVLYPFLPRPLQYELAVGQFPYPVWKNMFEQLKSVVDGEAPRVPANLSLSPEFTDYLHLWWVYINYTASQYYPTPLFYCIGSTTLTLGNHGLPPIAQECY